VSAFRTCRSAASLSIVRLPDAKKYHMSASHGITCHSETLIRETIPPCLLAADVAPANRNTEVDHPAKPSCHDEATCMQDQLSQGDYHILHVCMYMYALLDSFSALYHMLVPGCQPALYSKLSDCKGVFMTRRSPALYAMQCTSSASSSSISYIAHSITAVAACPPFADDWTGSREGQMSWHNGSLKSRATSQTLRSLRHMY
jgi:hypothetical protein